MSTPPSRPDTPTPSTPTLSRAPSPSQDSLPLAASLCQDDPASGAALFSPLFVSLRHVATDPLALAHNTTESIPVGNNPRPMRLLMNDSAEYWTNASGDLVRFKFPAQVDRNGQFGRIGPYFNLPQTGLEVADLQKARAQFELVALQESDPECPPEAIACSALIFDTLSVLWGEVENARSDENPPKKSTPFWRTYDPGRGDHYAFVVTTDKLFQNLPRSNRASAPRLSRADIGKSSGPMSPSKARASAVAGSSASSGPPGPPNNPGPVASTSAPTALRITDLPDPLGRYAGLIAANPEIANTKVTIPDVRDRHGVLITPGEYNLKILDGDYVEVEVILKLWEIAPKANTNGSRVYQIMLQSMRLLPYHSYSQANILAASSARPSDATDAPGDAPDVPDSHDATDTPDTAQASGSSLAAKGNGTVSNKGRKKSPGKGKGRASGKGKRKADDNESIGQSPTKKTLSIEDGDWVMTGTEPADN